MGDKLSAVSKGHGGGFNKPKSSYSMSPNKRMQQQLSQPIIITDDIAPMLMEYPRE